MDKLRMKSSDMGDGNVAKIAALFPHYVTERKGKDGSPELAIDFDKLRAELSKDVLDDGEERYQFTWPDKRAASRLANTPTDKTLRPDVDASIVFWNTENLYIEGDNLDVLKVLRENYLGKIKMIYIDPPYNTGNDFVYNDDFAQSYDDWRRDIASRCSDKDGNLIDNPMKQLSAKIEEKEVKAVQTSKHITDYVVSDSKGMQSYPARSAFPHLLGTMLPTGR